MKILRILAIQAVIVLASMEASFAQFPEGQDPQLQIEHNTANNQIRLIWQSYIGWTYFLEVSDDLVDWTNVNLIEPGNGTEKEWSFLMLTGNKMYWRLHATNRPGDPFTGDFDGDGINNQDELILGLNPLKADTDGDGIPDGYEVANGLNPLVNDATVDSDGDGRANITEYLANTNPQTAEVQPLAAGLMVFTPLE